MRKIIVSNLVSVDGLFSRQNGELGWFVWNDETPTMDRSCLLGS